MEKFINFKQLNVVKTGTTTNSGAPGLLLKDTGAFFTKLVLPNAIVWDRTTNGAAGGEMYIVAAVNSDIELSLTAIGPSASQGDGMASSTEYFIYMPEYTVRQAGTADGTGAFQLIDSAVDFIAAGVKIGDYALDITAAVTAKVTAVTGTMLTVDTDTFEAGDNYLVYASGADDHDKMLRSADLALVENNAVAANNSRVDFTYSSVNASVADAVYAYSDTGAAGNEDMRNALQDAAVASLETPWSDVTYDFPGLLNAADAATNATWLGGRNYFFLRIQ